MAETERSIPDQEQQQALLEALGKDYINLCLVDLDAKTVVVLKSTNGLLRQSGTIQKEMPYDEVCRICIEKYVPDGSRAGLAEAVRLDHVREMLAQQPEYGFLFEAQKDGKRQKFQMKYLRINVPRHVLMGFRVIQPRKNEQQELTEHQRKALKAEVNALQAEIVAKKHLEQALEKEKDADEVLLCLSRIYYAIYEIDLPNDTYKTIYSDDRVSHLPPDGARASVEMEKLRNRVVAPEYQERIGQLCDLSTLAERLEAEPNETLAEEYPVVDGNWHTARFIVMRRDRNGHVTHVLYTLRLTSDQKRKEQNYIALAEEADKANQAKTDFLRRMSHDIRTPINGIMGMIEVADRHRGDKEVLEECREKTLGAMEYLLSLVNNVLDIGKLESGELELEHRPFDLIPLLMQQLSVVGTQASESGVNFYGGREFSVIKHRYLIGSPVHLNRVLMNLANNAIKYNRRGGSVTLYCTELSSDDTTAVYQFTCSDTGLGMSEEFQKHAFDPFTQEGKQSLSTYNGSGLGLSIVKSIVEEMHGTIALKSQEGVGSTFTITIPFAIDLQETSRETVQPQRPPIDVTGCRALLVEDNELNREIAEILLEDEGLVVDCVFNGQEAVNIFTATRPGTYDYIFMDITMPVMDGLEATRRIRALDRPDAKTVPIIAMTANAFQDDIQQSFRAGMNAHLLKPLDFKKVKATVQKFAKENG